MRRVTPAAGCWVLGSLFALLAVIPPAAGAVALLTNTSTPAGAEDVNNWKTPGSIPRLFSLRPAFDRMNLPVRAQGKRGDCAAFAFVGALEYYYGMGTGNPSELSEQYAAWAAAQIDNSQKTEAYNLDSLVQGFTRYGICREAYMPYREGTGVGVPTQVARQDATRRTAKQPRWVSVHRSRWTNEELIALCTLIANRQPIALELVMVDGTYNPRADRSFTIDGKPTDERARLESIAGHSALAVGYELDDKWPGGGRIQIRNSWGTNWADRGYGWITFEYLSKHLGGGYYCDTPPPSGKLILPAEQPATSEAAKVALSRLHQWTFKNPDQKKDPLPWVTVEAKFISMDIEKVVLEKTSSRREIPLSDFVEEDQALIQAAFGPGNVSFLLKQQKK